MTTTRFNPEWRWLDPERGGPSDGSAPLAAWYFFFSFLFLAPSVTKPMKYTYLTSEHRLTFVGSLIEISLLMMKDNSAQAVCFLLVFACKSPGKLQYCTTAYAVVDRWFLHMLSSDDLATRFFFQTRNHQDLFADAVCCQMEIISNDDALTRCLFFLLQRLANGRRHAPYAAELNRLNVGPGPSIRREE
jgi:hypothetical protein